MLEYSVKDQFRLANTWISYFCLIIAGIGLITWILNFFITFQQEMLILSILFIDFGILIWSVIFIRRVRYLYGFYSPVIFFLLLNFLPFFPVFFSGNRFFSLDFSNTGVLYSSLLGTVDFLVFVLFLMHEMNKFYFATNILQVFLTFFSNSGPDYKISWKELSIKLNLTQKITELYIYFLVEFDPEIGESDDLDETFTSSDKTVSILHNLILDLETSPQENFLKSLNIVTI